MNLAPKELTPYKIFYICCSAFKIWDGKNNEVQLKSCHGLTKQLLAYEENPSKRVDSRQWWKEAFAKKMTTFKTKTGDKNWELTI